MPGSTKAIKQGMKSGFRMAGGWLLGMGWLGLCFWGIVEAFGTEANFSEGHHPSRVLGYFLLAAAAVIFVLTANRWKKYCPESCLRLRSGLCSNWRTGTPSTIRRCLFLV